MSIALSPVKSSNLAATGYDAASQTLAVQFQSGRVYHYAGVPPEAYADMQRAESVGSFFAKSIRSSFEGRLQEADE